METHTQSRDEQIRELQSKFDQLKGRNDYLEEMYKGRLPEQETFFKTAPDVLKRLEDFMHRAQQPLQMTVVKYQSHTIQ